MATTFPVGRSTRQRRPRGAEVALVVLGGVALTGPPRLAPGRELETALESPLALDPSALFRAGIWVGCGVIVAYLLVVHPPKALLRSFLRDRPVRWYLIFAALGGLSVLWSPAPMYTGFWVFKLAVGTFMAFLLAVHGSGARLDRPLRLFYYVHAIKLVVLLFLFFTNRLLVIAFTSSGPLGYRLTGGSLLEDYGVSPMITGLWLLSLGLFAPTPAKRRIAMVGYYATWLPLLLAQGRTGILAALACYLIMLSMTPPSRGKLVLITLGSIAFAWALVIGRTDSLVGLATRGGEGISNLTGRAEAFNFLMPIWRAQPLYGWGLGAGTRSALLNFRTLTGLNIGAGHDALSTVLVDLGLLGASVLGLVLLAMWRKVFRLRRRTRRAGPQRVVAAQLTCVATIVMTSCVFGPGIVAASGAFFAFLATAWGLERATRAGPRVPTRRLSPSNR